MPCRECTTREKREREREREAHARLTGRVRAQGGVVSLPFVCVEEGREPERSGEFEEHRGRRTHTVAFDARGNPEP